MNKIDKKVGPILESVPMDDLLKTPRFETESERLVGVLIYVSSWMDDCINNTLKPFDITRPQLNLLMILHNNLPAKLPTGLIATRMIDKTSNVTRLADRLISRGVVLRSQNEVNRRIHELSLTPKGIKLFEEIRTAMTKNVWNIPVEKLSEEEVQTLTALLFKLKS